MAYEAVILHPHSDSLDLREHWNRCCDNPNSDHDHHKLVCELKEENCTPLTIVIYRDHECHCILAGRVESTALKPKLGYWRPLKIRSNSLNIVTGGILGKINAEIADILHSKLLEILSSRKVDHISIKHLSKESSLWSRFESRSTKITDWKKRYKVSLSGGPDQILGMIKKKHRYNLRRNERLLSERFNNEIEWEWHRRFDNLEEILQEVEDIAQTTYQRGLGSGFQLNEFNLKRYELFAKNEQLRVLLLKTGGKPAAFWMGQIYKGTFHSDATGYTPEVSEYAVGTSLLKRLFDHLNEEGGKTIDYGIGDAEYKSRFSDDCHDEANLDLYSNNVRGRMLKLFAATLDKLHAKIGSHLDEHNIARKLKTSWRRKIKKRLK